MHRLPSLDDWMVWADMLQQIDPEPWRDRRIHKRIVRGDPNNVSVDRLSMSKAYCPGQVEGVFEWAAYSIQLTEHGRSHDPPLPCYRDGIAYEIWRRSPWAEPAMIYVRPDIYRHLREDRHVLLNGVEAHMGRVRQARNPRRRDSRGEHKRGRRRT